MTSTAAGFSILDTLMATSRDFCFVKEPPGGTDELSHRMATGIAMGEAYPTGARVRMAPDKPGIRLPSIVSNTNAFLIVDEPTRSVIEASETGEIEYLPLGIVNHKGRLASDHYFIVNPIGALDCMHLEHSDIEWLDGEIVDVMTHVLARKKLSGLPDLFRIRETPRVYVVSDALAAQLNAAGTTNLRLTPLQVAD